MRNKDNSIIFDRWGRPYYYYDIEERQNDILYSTERTLSGRAIVRYASPCFHTFVESEIHVASNTLAVNTNFQSPSRLRYHDIYTYTCAYGKGKAFSEPEEVEPSVLY